MFSFSTSLSWRSFLACLMEEEEKRDTVMRYGHERPVLSAVDALTYSLASALLCTHTHAPTHKHTHTLSHPSTGTHTHTHVEL